MTTKIRTILLTGLFVFAMLTGLQAQEKYEYGMITAQYLQLFITTNDENTVTAAPKGEDFKVTQIKALNKMANDGWEVYNTTEQITDNGHVLARTYFLRRKLKD